MRFLFSRGIFAGIVVAVGAASAQASEAPQAAGATAASTAAPAPSARVGRVSLASGKVEFRGPGESQWTPASLNDPVAAGVALRTDPLARAEIRIGPDTIDLAESTEVAVEKLDERSEEIAVRQGRVDLDVRRLDAGESIQIDIARGGVWPLQPGRYDVDLGGGGRPPRIAAFTGGARFAGGGADFPIAAGDRAVFGNEGPIATTEPASGDEFAEWCGARAVDESQLAAPYFISREMTGYAALDTAGRWKASAKYGEVWVPKASPAEWAPYRNGHWRWLAPWGWSWVDDQPWGFAATHYGRWTFADGQWSWAPGGLSPHPVWAPAVVAFLGTPGVGLSYADGPGPAVAWFALAPGEIYWPSYTSDRGYISAVNRGEAADLSLIRPHDDNEPPVEIANAHFANREYASVVPRPVFVAGGPVAAALVTIPDQRLRNAPAIMGSPRIGPTPAVRVAAAPAMHEPLPAVVAQATKATIWTSIVRVAMVRGRNFQEAARLRFAHTRMPAYAEVRLRHTLVLRVARADHAALHPEARKRVIRR